MPELTPNLNIPMPLETENVNRASFNAIYEQIDTAVPAAISEHSNDTGKHIQPGERAAWNAKETTAGALAKIEQTSFKKKKSNEDNNEIFTTVEYRRKSDNTLAVKAVLSGGTSPYYTTRTFTYYAANGTSVVKTETFALTYNAKGVLVEEA